MFKKYFHLKKKNTEEKKGKFDFFLKLPSGNKYMLKHTHKLTL